MPSQYLLFRHSIGNEDNHALIKIKKSSISLNPYLYHLQYMNCKNKDII